MALALLSLFFVAGGEYGRSETPGAGKGGIVAALKGRVIAALQDPLALLAKRSPGHRGRGALHLTKTAAGPHERVLSEVRQRDLAPGLVPAPGAPVVIDIAPDAVAAPGAAADTAPVNGSLMPALVMPPAFPGFAGLPGPTADNSGGSGAPSGGTTPGGPADNGQPPGSPGGPGTPPVSPGGPSLGGPPPTITVGEPATWLLMISGWAVLLIKRRLEFGRTA